LQAFGALFAGPGMQLRAFAFVLEEWNAVAAGVGDAVDFHDDDRANAVVRREVCCQRGEFRVLRFDDLSAAVEAEDVWRALEGAKHENDSAIILLAQVGDGFDAAAIEVKVRDGAGVEDAKCVEAFRGKVDVPGGIERG